MSLSLLQVSIFLIVRFLLLKSSANSVIFTANCDSQARDEEDCERLANGVRCIFFNKTCSKTLPTTSLRHSFLQSILKGDSMLNSVNDAVQQQKYCPTHMDK